MEAFKEHLGLAAPLNRLNVDTDQIIPKQFLKRIERTGFGQFLFYDWRFLDNGDPNAEFVLNDPVIRKRVFWLLGRTLAAVVRENMRRGHCNSTGSKRLSRPFICGYFP